MRGTTRLVDRTYAYAAGTSGTVKPVGKVRYWAAFATGSGATVTINGGDSIPVPAGGSVDGQAQGDELVNPTFVFTGTSGYQVEYLT